MDVYIDHFFEVPLPQNISIYKLLHYIDISTKETWDIIKNFFKDKETSRRCPIV